MTTPNQPLSRHWADIAAFKVIKEWPDAEVLTVASGITPSGKIHIGNFREVVTVDMVARALQKLGKSVRFIYSWDNFDTFRKVPKNVPDPKAFEQYLFQPIARIPDPWGEAESYSAGRISRFESELKAVGIAPEYLYQEAKYSAGEYSELVNFALANALEIQAILNEHRTTPLPDSWLPTSVYCSKCSRDKLKSQSFLGDYQLAYECSSCAHSETIDIRESKNVKLVWRVDWPMRWFFEKVNFEPGGKDHSSDGGSFDTGSKLIAKLWDRKSPSYLQYDFVAIKGGTGKMSSSSGELYTLDDVLAVYEPQIVRWIFAEQKPNRDFAIAFDEDVFKLYDEFDRHERQIFEDPSDTDPKYLTRRASYQLSLPNGQIPDVAPVRAPFRELTGRLQICGGDVDRTFDKFYREQIPTRDRQNFDMRCQKAWHWLNTHAPQEFRYALHPQRIDFDLKPAESQALDQLRELINRTDLAAITTNDLNTQIWAILKESGEEPKHMFRIIYQKLIGRDQGPRLPGFIKEVGKERILELL